MDNIILPFIMSVNPGQVKDITCNCETTGEIQIVGTNGQGDFYPFSDKDYSLYVRDNIFYAPADYNGCIQFVVKIVKIHRSNNGRRFKKIPLRRGINNENWKNNNRFNW